MSLKIKINEDTIIDSPVSIEDKFCGVVTDFYITPQNDLTLSSNGRHYEKDFKLQLFLDVDFEIGNVKYKGKRCLMDIKFIDELEVL